MAVRQLTPEEEAKPYAKYYHRPLTPPDADLISQIRPDEQIDPALALPPERISDLLDPGYHEVETGWCVMPNGSGYLAVHNRMHGVTVEMLDWWFWWHSMASMRYGLWYPPGHYGISISKRSRAKLSDPNVPAKEKIYGRTDHVVEDIGTGAEDIYISFCAPEQMGFDMSRFHAPNVAAVYGGYGFDQPQGAKPSDIRAPAIMCHFIRELPDGDGVEFRSRFWMGYKLIDGKPVLAIPPGESVPVDVPYGLADHNVREYCNLKSLLPEIWAEFKDADSAL
jgi:hypothetical protein